MTATDVLRRAGVAFVERQGHAGTQLVLETCPFCSHRKKLWVNADHGAWICYHAACNRKGSLFELAATFGQSPAVARASSAIRARPKAPIAFDVKGSTSALLADESAMAYLTQRGLANPDLLRALGIGKHVLHGTSYLSLPRWRGSVLASVKLRAVGNVAHEDRYRCIGSSTAGLFNLGALASQKWAILCEGEINVASWVAAGVPNAVSVGAASAQGADPEEILALSKLDYVVLNYDRDEAGRAALAELVRRLGPDRCRVLDFDQEWETKDANEVLVGLGAEALRNSVATAKPCEIEGVKHVGQVMREMLERLRRQQQDPQAKSAVIVPWANLREFFQPDLGHLVILVGHPKTGKTTAALQVAYANAVAGVPAIFWCLEMPATEIVKKIAAQHFERPWGDLTDTQLDLLCDYLDDRPLYLGFGSLRSPDEAYRQLRAAARVFGAKVIVLDNLHYLSRGQENEHAILGSATKYMKELAMEMDLCLLLIAQPKMDDTSKSLGLYAARGTAAAASDCDTLIVLSRSMRSTDVDDEIASAKNSPAPKPLAVPTVAAVVANRYGPPGKVLLYYRPGEERFSEGA